MSRKTNPSQPYPLLLLWDIDGTLLKSGGQGMESLYTACENTLGIPLKTKQVIPDGKTDPLILEEIFRRNNIVPPNDKKIEEIKKRYFSILESSLKKNPPRLLKNILPLIQHCDNDPSLFQGLLTGNFKQGALIKLQTALPRILSNHDSNALAPFLFGAFGDDASKREDLIPIAMRQSEKKLSFAIPSYRVILIGDSIRDVQCGKHHHVQTVTVATGSTKKETLKKEDPDLILSDFSSPQNFFNFLKACQRHEK